MKKRLTAVAIVIVILMTGFARAQGTSYSFTTGSSWSFTNLAVNGSNLDFVTSGASSGSATFLGSAPSNSNWSAQVAVNLNPALATPADFPPEIALLGLTISGAGKAASIAFTEFQPPSPVPSGYKFTGSIDTTSTFSGSVAGPAGALNITYNAGTTTLSTFYGATPLQSVNISSWGMTASDVFGFQLIAESSSGVTATSGQAYFSDFQGAGLTLAAVPEPGTCAAVAGLAALGLALYRRRR